MPQDWDKTLDELLAEVDRGERLGVSGAEIERAREHERSLLPTDTVFPRSGQVWEAIDNCEVFYLAIYSAPSTGGGRAWLHHSERVRIQPARERRPVVVSFLPLRYDVLHASIIPEETRKTPRYTNYCLWTKTTYFNRHFRLVAESRRAAAEPRQVE